MQHLNQMFIERVLTNGERKTFKEWVSEIYPNIDRKKAESRMYGLLAGLKKYSKIYSYKDKEGNIVLTRKEIASTRSEKRQPKTHTASPLPEGSVALSKRLAAIQRVMELLAQDPNKSIKSLIVLDSCIIELLSL